MSADVCGLIPSNPPPHCKNESGVNTEHSGTPGLILSTLGLKGIPGTASLQEKQNKTKKVC